MERIFRLSSFVLVCSVLFNAEGAERAEIADSNQAREIRISVEKEPYSPDRCFDKIWKIINEEFWDPNFNGVDWDDARDRFRPKALAAKDHESFAAIVNQMLAELQTSHTYYYTKWDPDYYTLQAALISGDLVHEDNVMDTAELERRLPGLYSSQGNPHRTGIGVVTKKLDGRHYVTAVLDSSPAEKAGIVLGDWIVEVNGKSFHPIRSFENKDGQEVEITIQRNPSASSRQTLKITPIDAKERQMFEKDALERSKEPIEYKGHRFSYIRLWWLLGWKMRGVFETAIWFHGTEGIIIDIRDGFGGGPAMEYIHPFLEGGLEKITQEFVGRKKMKGETPAAYNRPVIVLINGGSRSGKELLAYYFKKTRRGLVIGERTAGFVCAGSYKRISEESLLLYGAAMLTIDGKRLEGVGVAPDIEVPFDIRFAGGKDLQLEHTKDEMVSLIEAKRK